MEKPLISIVYHSGFGHTRQVAEIISAKIREGPVRVHLVPVGEALQNMSQLHSSDTIIFGCPTYFGTVSSEFKKFMEDTGSFWYKQPWKDKLAAGFTVSSTASGDKLNTLTTLSLFAAQHSMIWLSQGILPRFINDQQTEGQNRLGSYLGLMIQSDNNLSVLNPVHPGDLLSAELFAARILSLTLLLKPERAADPQVSQHPRT